MDMLVLADENGVVDMTPTSISARTRIPIDFVKKYLDRLEMPDPDSKTPDYEGRRIVRMDSHRNWGWVVCNYSKFNRLAANEVRKEQTRESMERLRTISQNADNQASVNECKVLQTELSPHSTISPSCTSVPEGKRVREKGNRFQKPTIETAKLHGLKIGLPAEQCERFYDYYEANGWRVGKNPMVLWTAAMANWKRHWNDYGSNGGSAKSAFPETKIKAITALIDSHPANPESTSGGGRCSPQQVEEYKKLKRTLKITQCELAGIQPPP